MNKEQKIREQIIKVVNEAQGIKGVDLSCRLTEYMNYEFNMSGEIPITTYSNLFQGIMEELVAAGEIIEVEYVLPSMDYRTKSMFFPKKTEIKIRKNKWEK